MRVISHAVSPTPPLSILGFEVYQGQDYISVSVSVSVSVRARVRVRRSLRVRVRVRT